MAAIEGSASSVAQIPRLLPKVGPATEGSPLSTVLPTSPSQPLATEMEPLPATAKSPSRVSSTAPSGGIDVVHDLGLGAASGGMDPRRDWAGRVAPGDDSGEDGTGSQA